jgi:hypothetical protein
MHARYYNGNLGRFLSVDPVLGDRYQPQTWNRYAYAENNPIRLTDPTGRCPTCVVTVAEMILEETAGQLSEQATQLGIGALVLWAKTDNIPKVDPEGKPTGDTLPAQLGSDGPKIDSKTLWLPKDRPNEDGTRVDVENPAPGKRPGQVQIQRGEGTNAETYTVQRAFDRASGKWGFRIAEPNGGGPAPGWVRNLLKDAAVRDAILKGMQKYLNEADFNFTRLLRW